LKVWKYFSESLDFTGFVAVFCIFPKTEIKISLCYGAKSF